MTKYRDAVTGEYVDKEYADDHPDTTVAEEDAPEEPEAEED